MAVGGYRGELAVAEKGSSQKSRVPVRSGIYRALTLAAAEGVATVGGGCVDPVYGGGEWEPSNLPRDSGWP